jgi:type IV pilus assembly protein PilB
MTPEELFRKMCEEHGLDFVNLNEVVIPPSVIKQLPESVARENAILPLSEEGGTLKVIMSNPLDYDTREKLRFILNRNIEIVLAPRDMILNSINKYYGQVAN